MKTEQLLNALLIVGAILAIYWIAFSGPAEGYDPGYYANGDKKRMIPVLLDDSGMDSDFWFLDRQQDRINGFYKGSNLSRTSCDFVQNYEKMLPWGSKIYVDGGPTYDI